MPTVNFKNNQAAIFIICLLIAIFFWTVTALNKPYITTVWVPVTYKNIPLSVQIEKPLPSKISIDIEGKGFDLMSDDFVNKNNNLTIDFNSAEFRNLRLSNRNAVSTESLLKHNLSVNDPSYTIVKVLPDSIVLNYTKKFTVKVPVKLNAELNFKKQFFNSLPPLIKPESIELSGPEILIKKIAALETQKVIFNDIHSDLFFSASLLNPSFDKIILSENKVWIMVPVDEFTEGKAAVTINKIYYHNKPVTLIPDKINITYQSSLKNFASLSAADFEAAIDQPFISIDKNENKLRVTIVKFPKSAKIVSVQPEWVDYLIEK